MGKNRYKIHDAAHPYFITLSIVDWLPVFTNRKIAGRILESLRFMQEHSRIKVFAYVIMENHMHMVVSSADLHDEISKFKSFTARQAIDILCKMDSSYWLTKLHLLWNSTRTDREHRFWQSGCHPKQIINEDMMRQKIEYIHNNPVKRGYISRPWFWRYSSAGFYRYGKGIIPVTTDWT